jgi:membrane protease subunit HflK
MAWNEPGNGNKNPWGGRNNDGPPDLDDIFRNLQAKLSNLFGGGGGPSDGSTMVGLGLILAAVFVIWLISGIYFIDEGERGVVRQFGRYIATTQAGPHWYPRLIQSVEKVSMTYIRQSDGSAQVLTGDENIVQVKFTIQYNVKDPAHYLFKVSEPDLALRQAAESAFRELIGKNTLDYVIQDGRDEVPEKVKQLLQESLDLYGTGLNVVNVNLIDAQPPQEVQGAFDDAIKAREDKDRFIKESEAYSNEIIPAARGTARSMVEQAKAYEFSVIKGAQGEAERFLKLLAEYEKAPQVTRERLYLEALESVFANSGKVLIDVKGGNNMIYLPLDKINSQSGGRVYIEPVDPATGAATGAPRGTTGTTSTRDDYRAREKR